MCFRINGWSLEVPEPKNDTSLYNVSFSCLDPPWGWKRLLKENLILTIHKQILEAFWSWFDNLKNLISHCIALHCKPGLGYSEQKRRDPEGLPRAGRAAPRDFPRGKPKWDLEEQPCQPEENLILPNSFTQINSNSKRSKNFFLQR